MDRKKKLWNTIKTPLKIGVTCALIYYVFQKIDVRDLKRLYLTSNLFFIFLALLSFLSSQFISSWRLLSFLKSIGINVSFWYNFRLYMLGMFYNIYGGIGGDGYKIYLLRKRFQQPTKRIFFALLLDRVSGLWALGFISVILILLIPRLNIPIPLVLFVLLAGTAAYYFVLQKFFSIYNNNFLKAHAKAVAVQSLQLLSVIFILLSQDFTGKFSPYLFSFLVSSVAAIIPIGAFGFGTREYVMTHASSVFEMRQALAVYVTLTFSFISTFISLSGVYFVYQSKEFEPAPTEEEAEQFEEEADKAIEEQSPSP
ncbi:lysylphosphatidylglycerol synthase transmembrane domain-containing protein [Pedobacter sp. SYSU D00535]|uniref:lysylphosphatidylglycerol synthase transmembrane domain-containing protein n=1 Tax=Pedobacter sp. SYSU D00535 TaxID=2810308 RepID=UPI001A97CD79|nr:lysylphosphatidylglycerol synthase transmembrane domain-containing protein [Pedobacter sp. SYSU D00535]